MLTNTVGDESSVVAMVRLAVDSFGGLDLIHANAVELPVLFKDSNALGVDLALAAVSGYGAVPGQGMI